jgi:Brp/Blh family beta-carotene 15,15'-monooxygenase
LAFFFGISFYLYPYYMVKIQEISIVTSFIGLWAHPYLPDQYEIFFGFLLIFTFGLLHGANDLLIIHKFTAANKKVWFGKLTGYVASVLGVGIFFYLFPTIGLIGFLIYSAYHFGEQHLQASCQEKSSFQTGFLYFLYGMTVLLLLFSHNDTAVKSIVHEITQHTLSNLYTTPLFSVFCIGFLCCYFFIHKWKTNVLKKGLKELFFLGLLSLIFRSSSLIWGFAIYFIFWHSIPSLFDQIVFLYGNARREKILSYSKKAFPYWLISVLGILLIHHYFAEDKQFSSSFFCIIAAVTFPHAFIMRKMFRSK